MTIENSSFTYCAAMLGGAIYSDGLQMVEIKNSNFTKNFAYEG